MGETHAVIPSTRTLRPLAVALVLMVMTAACSSDGKPEAASTSTAATATAGTDADVVPPEAETHAADWPLPGRDLANSRAVVESPITTETVDRLAEVWSAPLEGSGMIGNAATTPLILGDQVLVQDLSSNVRSFDRATGQLAWRTRVDLPPPGIAETGCHGARRGRLSDRTHTDQRKFAGQASPGRPPRHPEGGRPVRARPSHRFRPGPGDADNSGQRGRRDQIADRLGGPFIGM